MGVELLTSSVFVNKLLTTKRKLQCNRDYIDKWWVEMTKMKDITEHGM